MAVQVLADRAVTDVRELTLSYSHPFLSEVVFSGKLASLRLRNDHLGSSRL